MYPKKTRFKKEIVAEFLPPKDGTSKKAIIICPGMPSFPAKSWLLNMFVKQGWWAFTFRYRGSWESDGKFLAKSPHQDVLDIADELLHKGFTAHAETALEEDEHMRPELEKVCVLGSSFGGPAAILASLDERIHKAVALCPVIDWRIDAPEEPLEWLKGSTRLRFGRAYDFADEDWAKLTDGRFFNPIAYQDQVDGKKLLLSHAKDDLVVPYQPTEDFAKKTGSQMIPLKKGGHGSFMFKKWRVRRKVMRFLEE